MKPRDVEMAKQRKIFISHAHEDSELAEVLKNAIQTEFENVYVFHTSDKHALSTGEAWLDTILSELKKTDLIIPLITPCGHKNMWVAFEYGYVWAKKGEKYIHTLFTPRTPIPSPLNTRTAKSVIDEVGLQKFFSDLFNNLFNDDSQKPLNNIRVVEKADLNSIVEKAKRIPLVTDEEKKVQVEAKLLLKQARSSKERNAVIEGLIDLNILQGAKFNWIGDLRETSFVNFEGNTTRMHGIDLGGNCLNGANFERAELINAILGSTDLRGANLTNANLEGASVQGAVFDEETKFPNSEEPKNKQQCEEVLVKLGVKAEPLDTYWNDLPDHLKNAWNLGEN